MLTLGSDKETFELYAFAMYKVIEALVAYFTTQHNNV